MATFLNINKKTLTIAILLAGLIMSLSVMGVRAAANDSSITMKKDPGSGLFTLTVKDPDGIQEFSMTPTGKFPYGGGLSGCPKTFSINNTSFMDPADFEPTMPAYVIDCRNNTADLEIAPPKDGLAKGVSTAKEEIPPAPNPLPKEEPKPEKKGGPLSASDVVYPVKELGDCQNEAECRSYCDNSQNAKECFAFARKYNLITKKEAEDEKEKFLSVNNGPGGCSSGASCETYCNNVDHLDECISFAEKNGYYSGDELAEAKKFQELVKAGTQFPGGCKDRNTCEMYCNDSRHMEECLNFAEASGFMPKEEIDQARKILPLMQRGETPGGCTSKEQCEKYCFDDSHAEECIAFGEKVGLISSEDAAMIKKTGGKGPGGCRSKEQCESYCENNSDECFQWAQDNGFFTEADAARMKEGLSHFKDQLDQVPPEVVQCLKDAVGEKNFEKLINGQPVFDRSLEGKMKSCFNQITSQLSQQLNTIPPEASQCIKDAIGEEGLQKLQSGEFDQNVDFQSLEGCFQQLQSSFGGGPGGPGGPGGFAGPGGCKSIEECTAYCQGNPNECQKFAPPGGGGFQGGPGGGGGQDAERSKLFEQERQIHTEINVPRESAEIQQCLKEKLGEEVFKRRQVGRLTGKEEGLLVEDAVFTCGGGKGALQRWQELIRNAPENDKDCLESKLGKEAIDQILKGERVRGASNIIESECRFLSAPKSSTSQPSQYPQHSEEQSKLLYQQQYQQQYQQSAPPGSSSGAPQFDCSVFASVPSCSYVGESGSQSYNYCKQCYPDK